MRVNLSKKELRFLIFICELVIESFFELDEVSLRDEKTASIAYNLHNRFENLLLSADFNRIGEKNGGI